MCIQVFPFPDRSGEKRSATSLYYSTLFLFCDIKPERIPEFMGKTVILYGKTVAEICFLMYFFINHKFNV